MRQPVLPVGLRSTLEALARTIVPQAFGTSPAAADLMSLLEHRLYTAPRQHRADFVRALRAINSVLLRFLISGSTTRWSAMEGRERSDAFDRWGYSRLGFARTVHQAIRRLVLSVYYSSAGAHHDIGVLPPLHKRQPLVPWEGPVFARAQDDSGVVSLGPRIMPMARTQPLPSGSLDGVTPGRELGGRFRIAADAVVIGSGAAGSVVASRLAEAGHEVVILEEGSWFTANDFIEDEAVMVPKLFADAGLRATDDLAVTLFQGGAAGGGTTVNWMLMLRTPDFVLDEWQRRFGLNDLSHQRMQKAFDAVEHVLRVGEVPDEAHSPANRLLLAGATALGWRARAARINAVGCLRAGTCTLGCRYQAKQSSLLTWLPRAFLRGARLFTESRVERIELRERQTAGNKRPLKRVVASALDPVTREVCGELEIDTPLVILAAGAVGSPVILQQSGLGGGVVGKYLRVHPTVALTGEFDHDVYALAGVPQTTLCDQFLARGENEYGFWLECPAMTPGLAALATPGFGEGHRMRMVKLHRSAPVIALTRDGADLRDSNGSVSIDRWGRRHIRYRLGERDKKTVARATQAAAQLLLAAGASSVTSPHVRQTIVRNEHDAKALATADYGANRVTLFSAHLNGTCRMGSNSRVSAVNPTGESHGTRGLYVCDGSILPTAPGVNPQETIMALAWLLAEGMVNK